MCSTVQYPYSTFCIVCIVLYGVQYNTMQTGPAFAFLKTKHLSRQSQKKNPVCFFALQQGCGRNKVIIKHFPPPTYGYLVTGKLSYLGTDEKKEKNLPRMQE